MPWLPRPLHRTCSAQGAVRESRWTRVTSLGLRAMSSVVVALFFSISLCVSMNDGRQCPEGSPDLAFSAPLAREETPHHSYTNATIVIAPSASAIRRRGRAHEGFCSAPTHRGNGVW